MIVKASHVARLLMYAEQYLQGCVISVVTHTTMEVFV